MGDKQDLTAVIYVSDGVLSDRVAAECAQFCEQEGWRVGSFVQADAKDDRWADAVAVLMSGDADVLVVANRGHLPPDRLPRLVVIQEERDRRRRGDGFRPRQRPRRVVDPR